MPDTSVPRLFQPVRVGRFNLAHRVVLAPLTRFRANADHVHGGIAVEYYAQRASIPGTLLITEATFISAKAGGYNNIPGIWNEKQILAWKRVTDAVHEKGSRIFCQLWAMGRTAVPDVLRSKDPSFPYVSASDIRIPDGQESPRPLTIPEIKEYVHMHAVAAENAIRAGFDGIEIHGANGYLVDQFLQDVCNRRTDEYGGSIENRCRFALEVLESVASVIGANRTSFRFSPWAQYQGMGMEDPKPTFSYLVEEIAKRLPDLAYIHVIEPRVEAYMDRESKPHESNHFIREIWGSRPYIAAGGYNRDLALETVEKYGGLVAFGRPFLANPDLPLRLAKNLPLNKADRNSYYMPEAPEGYTDYPFSDHPSALL